MAAAVTLLLATVACTPAGADVVASFVAVTTAPERSMHIELDGTVGGAGVEGTLSGEYDVDGADYSGWVQAGTAEFEGAKTESIAVAGEAWSRSFFGEGWQRARSVFAPPDPFAGLTAGGVEYVAPIDRGGSPFHRLRILDAVPALERLLAPIIGESSMRLELLGSALEVVVAGDGTPTEASLSMQARIVPCAPGDDCEGMTAQSMSMSLEYTFSDWGRDFEIVPPVD